MHSDGTLPGGRKGEKVCSMNTMNRGIAYTICVTALDTSKVYTATDVYDTTTKKEQSKSLTINDWITAATNKGWIINS